MDDLEGDRLRQEQQREQWDALAVRARLVSVAYQRLHVFCEVQQDELGLTDVELAELLWVYSDWYGEQSEWVLGDGG